MDTQFVGEHLWPGKLGHLFVISTFVGALFSAFSYWRAVQTEKTDAYNSHSWQLMGRNGFVLHAASIIGIFFALYYIIANHLFEYHYAWQHSSLALRSKYLLSCFWEGSEGSFMLWTLWNSILGLVVMSTAKLLETRTMAIISLVQAILATMLLGFYFGPDVKVGSTPFMLLREQMQGAPIFSSPNYMDFIKDGNGLNPLLQNYWMVIHPPVLFLGFATTLMPFAYCVAALWKGEYESFVKPTIRWSLFSGAVLGTGIMMGGAWAYESLNFGGYWAWDPVENASLVPWLTLVAGLHTLLVYKATKRSLIVTFILLLLTYLLVWYSTFLTRTGVLGKTSVHAFTGEGSALYWHLLIVLGVLLVLSIAAMTARWKQLPRIKTEEATSSREFWMFIGSIVLLLSAVQISITTSIPVWSPLVKWISGKDVAPPVDVMSHYNNIQVWVAIIIAMLSATILYLKFKQTGWATVLKRWGITGGIALVMAGLVGYAQKITTWQYDLLLFSTCFAIVANIYYAIAIQKAKLKQLGPSVAHLGFAMLLLGILISSYNKEVMSLNTLGVTFDLSKDDKMKAAKENRENVLLFRDMPVAMGEYTATFRGDSTSPSDPRTFFKVDYERVDTASKAVKERFRLYPDAFVNTKERNLISSPATKHYWNKDVFTYVNSYQMGGEEKFKDYTVHQGDSIFLGTGYLVFKGFNKEVNNPAYKPEEGDVAVTADLAYFDLKGVKGMLRPVYYIHDKFDNQIEDTLKSSGVTARLQKILPEQNAALIQVKQESGKNDYVVLKALLFPYINLVWLGVIVMVIGFFISLRNRLSY
ncbi:MAG: cytochrome c biogenesis protein CcsA [Bacteroidetes bacterium]|nr:cytochrome c biogenesis protein CcsA [Bacteroidota bacterium]